MGMKKSKKERSSRTMARELESEGSTKRSKSERSTKKKSKKERSSRNVSLSRSVEPQGKSSRDTDWDRGNDDDETARLKAERKAEPAKSKIRRRKVSKPCYIHFIKADMIETK